MSCLIDFQSDIVRCFYFNWLQGQIIIYCHIRLYWKLEAQSSFAKLVADRRMERQVSVSNQGNIRGKLLMAKQSQRANLGESQFQLHMLLKQYDSMEPTQMATDGMAALGKPGTEKRFLPKACSSQAPALITQPLLPKWPPRLQVPDLRGSYSLQIILSNPSQPSIFWKSLFP